MENPALEGAKAGFKPSGSVGGGEMSEGQSALESKALPDTRHRLQWNTIEKS